MTFRQVDDLLQRGNELTVHRGSEIAGRGVQLTQLCERHVAHFAGGVGRARQDRIVDHHQFAVAAEVDVELQGIRPLFQA